MNHSCHCGLVSDLLLLPILGSAEIIGETVTVRNRA